MNENKKTAIDFTVFKLVGVYQMVDPSSPKIFGYNVYILINITLIALTTALTIFGTTGFFFKVRDTFKNSDFDIVLIVFYCGSLAIGNFKTIMIIRNAKNIWNLFGVSHESSLTNVHYKKNYSKVINCGALLSKFFFWYLGLILVTLTSYAMIPIIYNRHFADDGETQNEDTYRKRNIINLRYPLTARAYNRFYPAFYAIECVLAFYTGFGTFAFDLFALTMLMIISTQYELMASALEVLERRVDDTNDSLLLNDEELHETLLVLISDCQFLYEQLKLFYDIARTIGLLQMLGDASGMICMPYLIVLLIKANGSFFNTETIRFVCTLGIAGLQSYMYCNLFQLVTDKKEALNFALYSCDWTKLNIRLKKLILFTMQINNSSNSLKMKVTATKSIDLPMLAYIIRSSYSIVSVMTKRKS